MYNEPLKAKAYDKLKEATLIYAERMYVKIGELQNVCGYITKEHLIKRIESRNGIHTIEAASELSIGSREYELISID